MGKRGRWRRSADYSVSTALLALASFAAAGSAHAQETPPQAGSGTHRESAGSGEVSNEIVVTARRREEALQDIPVAAVVVTGETVSKYAITDLTQISVITPGLTVQRLSASYPGGAISIRGIRNFGADAGLQQPVAIVVDDVPVSRGYIMNSGFFDLENVQVLKGPQSTFFGKNSPAGVLALSSVNPEPGQSATGYVRASYGFSQKDPDIEAAISLPLSDTLAVRFAGRGEAMQEGFVKNLAQPFARNLSGYAVPGRAYDYGPQTHQAIGRATLVWKPSSVFDARLKYLYSYNRDVSTLASTVLSTCDNGRHPSYQNLLTGQFYEDTLATCGRRRVNYYNKPPEEVVAGFPDAPADGDYFAKTVQQLISLVMNYDTPIGRITSTTGYYDLNFNLFDDYSGTQYANVILRDSEYTKTFNQELRFVSDLDGPLNFTVGAFYEVENRTFRNIARTLDLAPYPVPGPFFGNTNQFDVIHDNRQENYSAFGQVVFNVLPTVELAAGGRYSEAKVRDNITTPFTYSDLFYLNAPGGPALNNPTSPSGAAYRVKDKFTDFSPEVTLTWKVMPQLTVYGAYKSGFLSGGVQNASIVSNYTRLTQEQLNDQLIYEPETAKGIELGIKGRSADNRFNADLTLFRYIYSNIQIATLIGITFNIGNAASAINKGFDLNASYRFNDNFSLRGSVNYVENRFRKYANAPCYTGQACPGGSQDLSGTRFSAAPWTITAGATYEDRITNGLRFSLSADLASYTKSPSVNRQPNTATEAYTIANATLRLFQDDGPWEAALIVTNLTNELYLTGFTNKPLGKPQDLRATVNPGREFRLRVGYKF